jgi:protein associated with RNAse G/E
MKSKYNAVKCVVNGIKFDSKKEARAYVSLKQLHTLGKLSNLELQVPYVCKVNAVKICTYKADFRITWIDGKVEILDAKGFKTPVYKLKKKLVEALHNIKIVEI